MRAPTGRHKEVVELPAGKHAPEGQSQPSVSQPDGLRVWGEAIYEAMRRTSGFARDALSELPRDAGRRIRALQQGKARAHALLAHGWCWCGAPCPSRRGVLLVQGQEGGCRDGSRTVVASLAADEHATPKGEMCVDVTQRRRQHSALPPILTRLCAFALACTLVFDRQVQKPR